MHIKKVLPALLATATLGLVFFFRPWLHGILMLLYLHPVADLLFILLGGAAFFTVRQDQRCQKWDWAGSKRKSSKRPTSPKLALGSALGLLVTLVAYGVLAGDLSRWVAVSETEYYTRADLPETRQPRILPLTVAAKYGVDALQEPTQYPYEWQPVLDGGGRLVWTAARVPDGIVRYFTRKTAGIMMIPADSSAREVRFLDRQLEVSEGVAITDNLYWNLYKHRYFVDIPEVFYSVERGDTIVAIAPIIEYRGFPIRFPVFGGYFAIYPDGRIREYGVSSNSTIAAGRLYPESLARFYHEAYAFKNGLINNWFYHEDQVEIDDPETESNGQPYLLDTVEGLLWVTAADPYGSAFGIFKIFVTNALTGRTEVIEIPKQSALTGPQQALGYVRSAYPQFNWATSDGRSSSGNIRVVEPRPEVIRGQLFWLTSVTTTDSKGVNLTCFVDAKTNKVVGLDKDSEVRAFLKEEEVLEEGSETSASSSPAESFQEERLKELERLLKRALEELQQLKY